MGSALFGMGGGPSSSGAPNPEAPKPPITVNPNATPQEIMAAWKASLQANGEDVDAAFVNTFLSHRS